MSNTSINGYDLSYLSIPMKTAQAAREKKPENPFEEPKKVIEEKEKDPIQEAIKEMNLADKTEFLPQILKELGLLKFWGRLLVHPDYFVSDELAANRALNFYEASVAGSLSTRETKVGMIVAILTAAYCRKDANGVVKKMTLHNVNSPIPCFSAFSFMPITTLTSDDVDQAIVDEAEAMLKKLSRSCVSDPAVFPNPQLGKYFLEAMKMWPLSERVEVLCLSSRGLNKVAFLQLKDIPSKHRPDIDPCYQISDKEMKKYVLDLKTPWSRAKAFKFNLTKQVQELLSQ